MALNPRNRKLFAEEIALAMELMNAKAATADDIADHFGVSTGSLYRMMARARKHGFDACPPRRQKSAPCQIQDTVG